MKARSDKARSDKASKARGDQVPSRPPSSKGKKGSKGRQGSKGNKTPRVRGKAAPQEAPATWVASAMPGTEDLLKAEIERRFVRKVDFVDSQRADEHHFTTTARPAELQTLALCHALHVRRDYPVIRPRGLLSPEHLRDLAQQMRDVMALTPTESFSAFRFDAAGATSPTFQRLGQHLSKDLDLPVDQEAGDLVVAVRPGPQGWQVLCRVGRRPLSARGWRQANYRGSLNANYAAAMVELARPRRGDRFLNAMCGSGTILLEALQRQRLAGACGIDMDTQALQAARINAQHAGLPARFLQADARRLPFAGDTFNIVCADLPWGQSHGSAADNRVLYGKAFDEAYRVSRRQGKLVILSQDTASLAAVAATIERCWELTEERTFVQRGFQPVCRVYVRR